MIDRLRALTATRLSNIATWCVDVRDEQVCFERSDDPERWCQPCVFQRAASLLQAEPAPSAQGSTSVPIEVALRDKVIEWRVCSVLSSRRVCDTYHRCALDIEAIILAQAVPARAEWMTPEEARRAMNVKAEHDRCSDGTHTGSFTSCPRCTELFAEPLPAAPPEKEIP